MVILEFISGIGEVLIFITPMTLVVGIINAIKKDGQSSSIYKVLAIISAYLIFIPMIFNS
ncbi:hypothetical protein [Proteiniclasticum sp.]|uniref:hypothetical protein n=1 Tax=Proteiniclasticum sp. TaxID=2053595 RepID=UPI00289A4508|nr:hypothetical protein [Proteiniclasticum sp.]